jgi:hypothetical protein
MVRQAVRQAIRQAHGPEQSRRTHGPERSRRTHHPEPSRRVNPKFQYSMSKTFEILNFGHWDLFVIWNLRFDGFVKNPRVVMPDLIRHPELIEFTG